MSYRDEVIAKIKDKYPFLSQQFGVKKIGLFGSVASDTCNNNSDIDLIVELERPVGLRFISLANYLQVLLGKKIDLITRDGLDNIRVKKVADDICEHVIYV